MNNAPTMAASARGWRKFRWSAGYAGLDEMMPMITHLADVPGVKFVPSERFIEVPQSAWALDAWQRLAQHAPNALGPEHTPAAFPAFAGLKREPYFHQRVGATFLAEQGGGLCADPMGLGKTTTGALAAHLIRAAERPGAANLIIAPAYTRQVWLRELLALGLIESEEQFCAVEGRDPLRPGVFRPEADWWFAHYDVVQAWAGRFVTNRRGRPAVALLDEMHWIKNPKSQRAKGAQAAAGVAAGRIGLTGTPLPNRPAELWWPLTVLDGSQSWGTHYDFRLRYCGAQPDGYGLTDGEPTRTNELHKRLSRRYLRRELADVGMDLPALTHRQLEASFSELAKAEHRALVESVGGPEAIFEALERGAGTETFAALHKLRQLTSRAKVNITFELLRDVVAQGESVVVFVHERAMGRQLQGLLGAGEHGEPLAFLATGAQAQAERDAIVDAFQAGKRPVLITTYGAMREGVTLHHARLIVLHDLDWVPANILQAEARVHRIGQRRAAVSTWVMVPDSFDTILARHIVAKADVMQSTLGIDAAASIVDELNLGVQTGASIDDEARRLMAAWASW